MDLSKRTITNTLEKESENRGIHINGFFSKVQTGKIHSKWYHKKHKLQKALQHAVLFVIYFRSSLNFCITLLMLV